MDWLGDMVIYVSHPQQYPGDDCKWFHITSDESLDELADFLTKAMRRKRRITMGNTNTNERHLARQGWVRFDIPYTGSGVALHNRAVTLTGSTADLRVVKKAGRSLKQRMRGRIGGELP